MKTGFLHAKTKTQITFAVAAKLIRAFSDGTAWFVSDLVGNPEDWFSHNEAQLKQTKQNSVRLAQVII